MTEVIREIGLIYRELEYISNIEFKKYGLNNNLYLYLVRIVENPNIIADTLANMLKVDKSTVSRSLRKLEDLGFIKKVYSTENRKNKALVATPVGEEIYHRIISEHKYSQARLLDGFSTQEEKLFLDLLSRSESNINKDWEQVKNGEIRSY